MGSLIASLKKNWRILLPLAFVVVLVSTRYPTVMLIILAFIGLVSVLIIAYIYVYYEKQMPQRFLWLAPYLKLPVLPKYTKSQIFPRQRLAKVWNAEAFRESLADSVHGSEAIEAIGQAISRHLRQNTPSGAMSIIVGGEAQGSGKTFMMDTAVQKLREFEPSIFTVKSLAGSKGSADWSEIFSSQVAGKINVLKYDHVTPEDLGEDFYLQFTKAQTRSEYADWFIFIAVNPPLPLAPRQEVVAELADLGFDSRLADRAKAIAVKPRVVAEQMGDFLARLMLDHARQVYGTELEYSAKHEDELHEWFVRLGSEHNLRSSEDALRAQHAVEEVYDELLSAVSAQGATKCRLEINDKNGAYLVVEET